MTRTTQTIERISALRFPERKMVKRMIASCQLADAQVDMDKGGFFAHSFIPPQWLVDMPSAEEIAAKKATEVVTLEPNKSVRKPPVAKADGACAQIRAWARANPEATKEDGIKQFPTLNPSTIQIQMRKVRLGQV